jgi:hypothetical protein
MKDRRGEDRATYLGLWLDPIDRSLYSSTRSPSHVFRSTVSRLSAHPSAAHDRQGAMALGNRRRATLGYTGWAGGSRPQEAEVLMLWYVPVAVRIITGYVAVPILLKPLVDRYAQATLLLLQFAACFGLALALAVALGQTHLDWTIVAVGGASGFAADCGPAAVPRRRDGRPSACWALRVWRAGSTGSARTTVFRGRAGRGRPGGPELLGGDVAA